MSLVSTASPWINDDTSKKRTPSIRKTVKKLPNHNILEPEEDIYSEESNSENRDSKVNELLDKMTSVNIDNDGGLLANFTPLSYPTIEGNEEKSILPQQYNSKRHQEHSNFSADNNIRSVNKTGDLNNIYDVPAEIESKPYYTSGLGIGKGNTSDSKMMDRLGYIVHLLEQQQNEKTNNIMEEYVLYVLLGTFVIFIVDSFSRGGKYIR